MNIHSTNSFQGALHPPRDASSNPGCAPSRSLLCVMPHSPSDVNLWPTDSWRLPPESRQSLDDSASVIPTNTRDQSADTVIHSMKERLEHVAHHPEGLDVPHVAVTVDGADRCQELLHRSPVTRLPSEILAYIFELYVTRLKEFQDGISSQGPSCLVQVCTFWKAIAESDPRLWTSIHLYSSESHQSHGEDVQRIQPVLDLHLKRSDALPISLTFTDYRTYHSDTEDLISLLVDRLRTHARRWKRIALHLASAYFPILSRFTPCDLSSLEHLHISCDVVLEQCIASGLHLNLESATNLKSFSYSGHLPSMADRIDLHWENLAEVSFEFTRHSRAGYTISRHFGHLAQCQNITTCSLGIDRVGRVNINHTITLPCLQTLRVRRLSPSSRANGVIDFLILPGLRTLEIDASYLVIWNQDWHDRNFSDLLTRSRCTLLHLSIQDVDFPNDELVRCLALSPALTSLRFIPCPRSQDISDVIRKLDVSRTPSGGQTRTQGHRGRHVADSGPLVVLLREITLASSVEGYLELMTAMFRSRVGAGARIAGVATLRRAEVVFFDMWHDTGANHVRDSGHRLEQVARFRDILMQMVSENRDENGREDESEDGLEASVVVNSPYLPEYIEL